MAGTGGIAQVPEAVAQLDGGLGQVQFGHRSVTDVPTLAQCVRSAAAPYSSVPCLVYNSQSTQTNISAVMRRLVAFNALTLLAGRQEERPACKN